MTDQPDTTSETARERITELTTQLDALQTELAAQRAQTVKASLLAEWEQKLPPAYRDQIVASEDEEEVRASLEAVTEQFRKDLQTYSRPTPAIGAPVAPPGSSPLPRWHGKKPSEISPRDWPAYKRDVLGLR